MEPDEQKELVILHFNDAYNIQPNKKGELGFLNFYEHVNRMRQQYPKSLLVFSGDAFAPSKLSRVMRGRQMVYCLKMLNINIACYGNHDFDYEPQHSLALAKECGFPWLMCNVKYAKDGKNIGEGHQYYIMTHQNIKIGFMGLAGPDFKGRLISAYKGLLNYSDANDYAKKVCKILKQKGCQLIIALTHMRRPADEQLAQKVPEIDIILGGHDHSNMNLFINKIPIVKSSSDFEMMSIVKIFPPDKLGQKIDEKKMLYGRFWNFQIDCKKVQKAKINYPQIQKYIEQALLEYHQYQKDKSIANNKPTKIRQPPEIPKSIWLFQYGLIKGKPSLSLTAGLSAQICFAKYVAFKQKKIYVGYKANPPKLTENFVEETLNFIYQQVKICSTVQDTVLYSPGICSVPYLVQIANMIYLPSHLLVGVTEIESLRISLGIANQKGYKCYAVVGYDPSIKNMLCAWIKFVEPPKQYIQLINELNIQNVLVMSVHDVAKKEHGSQRSARLLNKQKIQNDRNHPQGTDIYMLFVREGYGESPKSDLIKFKDCIKDVEKQEWEDLSKQPICSYIYDWQSGIDCIELIEEEFRSKVKSQKVRYWHILSDDSWNLYLITYYLGKKFIQFNYHKDKLSEPKGIVLNQYFFSNPTYQLNYGYIPIVYWQFYSQNQKRILSVLNEQQKKLKRWLNIHKGNRLDLRQPTSIVIKTDNQGKKLAEWVGQYAPKDYNLKYLPLEIVLDQLSKLKLLYKSQNQNQNIKFRAIQIQ